jgi:predicted transcriptional regulator
LDPLVAWLVQRRDAMGLTFNDAAFAREVGLSRSMWHFLSGGQKEPGIQTVRRVLARFPDDHDEILALVFGRPVVNSTQINNSVE